MHVGFDSTASTYYVCGYYENEDKYSYINVWNYEWVRYETATEIQEYYNGKKCIAAFQINVASFVTDIFPREAETSAMEHFRLYETNFVNGLNTNAPVAFEESFIYMNMSDESTIYYCMDTITHTACKALPCVLLDEQYYVAFRLYETESLKSELGEYYDVFMSLKLDVTYNVTNTNGSTYSYGLIPIDDFANEVLK